MSEEESTQSKGGKARALKLTKDERSSIAKAAATARWSLVRAEFEGDLEVPGVVPLRVANLSDGRRVMISRAFMDALGRPWKGTYQRTERPNFLDAKNLNQFVSKELMDVLAPIDFINGRGQTVSGYLAEALPLVCEVYLKARDADKLTKSQEPIAAQAELILRGLAKIGILSLVDDATGYTKFRARSELQAILAAYIAPEFMPWSKRFPDSYYEHIHRIRGWKYEPGHNGRNAYIGKLTNKLIYEQLPNGVLEELRKKNPRDPETKRRKRTHHQTLTIDVGHPHLDKQILVVTTLLSISDTWSDFCRHFSKRFPPDQGDLFSLAPPKDD